MKGYVAVWVNQDLLLSGDFMKKFNAGEQIKAYKMAAEGLIQMLLPLTEIDLEVDFSRQCLWFKKTEPGMPMERPLGGKPVKLPREKGEDGPRDLCQHDPVEDRE